MGLGYGLIGGFTAYEAFTQDPASERIAPSSAKADHWDVYRTEHADLLAFRVGPQHAGGRLWIRHDATLIDTVLVDLDILPGLDPSAGPLPWE
jgi:hypothetical protein